jgi:hypothetical protein
MLKQVARVNHGVQRDEYDGGVTPATLHAPLSFPIPFDRGRDFHSTLQLA